MKFPFLIQLMSKANAQEVKLFNKYMFRSLKMFFIPEKLKIGDTIGIFTPSVPGYSISNEVFEQGIKNLELFGFKVKLGEVTAKKSSQGYRSAPPIERANELNQLFKDKEVKAILPTIGGNNSNSLIPYLDYKLIKENPKIFSGYSDVTSLHLAIMKYANLATFYGPGLMPHWTEYPSEVEESIRSFMQAVEGKSRELRPFAKWSNHARNWRNDDWKKLPRDWKDNTGWKVLKQGSANAPLFAFNLNTLTANAGTPHFPDLKGKVLLLEQMDCSYANEERRLRQLQLMGVFDSLAGLIIGKPEVENSESAPFNLDNLILEVVSNRNYPIITNFDCSHTIPMHTIRLGQLVSFQASKKFLEVIKVE